MKGWFGKLECEEPAIIEDPAHANAACQAHFCLFLIERIQMAHNFKRHLQAQKYIQYCQAHFSQHTVLRQKFKLLRPGGQDRTKID